MELLEALVKHFHIPRGMDVLPIVAMPHTGRDMGRHQLAKAMNDYGCRRGVEIGVGGGRSALIYHGGIPDLHLVGIDSYPAGVQRNERRQKRYYAKAKERYDERGFELIKKASLEVVDDFEDESVDFVHIDGDHTFDFVMQDIIRWAPKVRKGGLVLCHDYCPTKRGGIVKAIDAYVYCHRIEPWYMTRDCNPTAFWERGIERA